MRLGGTEESTKETNQFREEEWQEETKSNNGSNGSKVDTVLPKRPIR
jgi:hypothetical protein